MVMEALRKGCLSADNTLKAIFASIEASWTHELASRESDVNVEQSSVLLMKQPYRGS